MKKTLSYTILSFVLFCSSQQLYATNYLVSTKTNLQNAMTSALPGDTVKVANGSYANWGQIKFTNNNGTPTSAWIVLIPQTPTGVTFTGTAYLQFEGKRLEINGFKFFNGSTGTPGVGVTSMPPVIAFRNGSGNLSSYCRVTNVTIDNFNTFSADSTVENEWVGMYGTNNRLDHCTFINKYNARATVVVWYTGATYPAKSTSTYHLIDSNYFKQRSFLGANGGETIRIGDSNSSRTDGFNTVEFNLFEDMIQEEPEIISNKSNFNTYRYNTFMNSFGGLTLRHGRYCSVYGNFFIVNNSANTRGYGVRAIDKGHKIYNNYFEGLNGNKNSLTSLRCPIILYNGVSGTNDTTNSSLANGYFPTDSVIVAFNTIVNCSGGAGIVIGYRSNSTYSFQPLGIVVANNSIKMTTGQAAYKDPNNTLLTYMAEGNLYQSPSGAGISPATGFTASTLVYSRTNGVLDAPMQVEDAAVNTANYQDLLQGIDGLSVNRSAVYDVGAAETNGMGPVITRPLDATMVGAYTGGVLAIKLLSFTADARQNIVNLFWKSEEDGTPTKYNLQRLLPGQIFKTIYSINAALRAGTSTYRYIDEPGTTGKILYRLQLLDEASRQTYSDVKTINFAAETSWRILNNPAKENIALQYDAASTTTAFARLTNVAGQVLLKKQIAGGTNIISIQGIPSGTYFLSISNAGGSGTAQKIIINK